AVWRAVGARRRDPARDLSPHGRARLPRHAPRGRIWRHRYGTVGFDGVGRRARPIHLRRIHFVGAGSYRHVGGPHHAARYPAAKGSRGISLFIVERTTPGISVTKLDKHGWLCSDTAEIAFQDVRVPLENLLGEENRGFYGIMETFENERICIGGICAGESAKAIELTTNYVKSRQAFGGPLWNQQAVRLKLASLATKAAAARALAYHAAELVEAGKPCPREVSMVKALSPEVLHEVVHGCLQLHGGTGFMRGTPI